MDKQLIEFDNAVEALGDSMLANMPEQRIKDVQQFREYFEQHTDAKLRRLGLRLIDESTSFAFMYRMSVAYGKVFDKSLEIGYLREEVTRRGLRLNGGIKA
ncbi:hypothetical protein [Priestia megaterium]|uniref:hypothetical protein n=1 Tax=Priestia megaterium TaxID=1404 RepID=UPI002E224B4B|nr:hypothetical protein [Priestia megaterium]MED4278284.1 hypothetical protein [Priestia megaterium]MED4314389.1 hypothetical protein [Priestia megaterium]